MEFFISEYIIYFKEFSLVDYHICGYYNFFSVNFEQLINLQETSFFADPFYGRRLAGLDQINNLKYLFFGIKKAVVSQIPLIKLLNEMTIFNVFFCNKMLQESEFALVHMYYNLSSMFYIEKIRTIAEIEIFYLFNIFVRMPINIYSNYNMLYYNLNLFYYAYIDFVLYKYSHYLIFFYYYDIFLWMLKCLTVLLLLYFFFIFFHFLLINMFTNNVFVYFVMFLNYFSYLYKLFCKIAYHWGYNKVYFDKRRYIRDEILVFGDKFDYFESNIESIIYFFDKFWINYLERLVVINENNFFYIIIDDSTFFKFVNNYTKFILKEIKLLIMMKFIFLYFFFKFIRLSLYYGRNSFFFNISIWLNYLNNLLFRGSFDYLANVQWLLLLFNVGLGKIKRFYWETFTNLNFRVLRWTFYDYFRGRRIKLKIYLKKIKKEDPFRYGKIMERIYYHKYVDYDNISELPVYFFLHFLLYFYRYIYMYKNIIFLQFFESKLFNIYDYNCLVFYNDKMFFGVKTLFISSYILDIFFYIHMWIFFFLKSSIYLSYFYFYIIYLIKLIISFFNYLVFIPFNFFSTYYLIFFKLYLKSYFFIFKKYKRYLKSYLKSFLWYKNIKKLIKMIKWSIKLIFIFIKSFYNQYINQIYHIYMFFWVNINYFFLFIFNRFILFFIFIVFFFNLFVIFDLNYLFFYFDIDLLSLIYSWKQEFYKNVSEFFTTVYIFIVCFDYKVLVNFNYVFYIINISYDWVWDRYEHFLLDYFETRVRLFHQFLHKSALFKRRHPFLAKYIPYNLYYIRIKKRTYRWYFVYMAYYFRYTPDLHITVKFLPIYIFLIIYYFFEWIFYYAYAVGGLLFFEFFNFDIASWIVNFFYTLIMVFMGVIELFWEKIFIFYTLINDLDLNLVNEWIFYVGNKIYIWSIFIMSKISPILYFIGNYFYFDYVKYLLFIDFINLLIYCFNLFYLLLMFIISYFLLKLHLLVSFVFIKNFFFFWIFEYIYMFNNIILSKFWFGISNAFNISGWGDVYTVNNNSVFLRIRPFYEYKRWQILYTNIKVFTFDNIMLELFSWNYESFKGVLLGFDEFNKWTLGSTIFGIFYIWCIFGFFISIITFISLMFRRFLKEKANISYDAFFSWEFLPHRLHEINVHEHLWLIRIQWVQEFHNLFIDFLKWKDPYINYHEEFEYFSGMEKLWVDIFYAIKDKGRITKSKLNLSYLILYYHTRYKFFISFVDYMYKEAIFWKGRRLNFLNKRNFKVSFWLPYFEYNKLSKFNWVEEEINNHFTFVKKYAMPYLWYNKSGRFAATLSKNKIAWKSLHKLFFIFGNRKYLEDFWELLYIDLNFYYEMQYTWMVNKNGNVFRDFALSRLKHDLNYYPLKEAELFDRESLNKVRNFFMKLQYYDEKIFNNYVGFFLYDFLDSIKSINSLQKEGYLQEYWDAEFIPAEFDYILDELGGEYWYESQVKLLLKQAIVKQKDGGTKVGFIQRTFPGVVSWYVLLYMCVLMFFRYFYGWYLSKYFYSKAWYDLYIVLLILLKIFSVKFFYAFCSVRTMFIPKLFRKRRQRRTFKWEKVYTLTHGMNYNEILFYSVIYSFKIQAFKVIFLYVFCFTYLELIWIFFAFFGFFVLMFFFRYSTLKNVVSVKI